MKGILAAGAIATVAFVMTISLVIIGVGADTPTAGWGAALRPGSVPPAYAALVQQAGSTCSAVSPALLAAQLQAESGWRTDARSAAGAQGIAQFMPDTWARWGIDGNGDGAVSPWDPADAIPAQARYDCALAREISRALRDEVVTGTLTELMLAAYNAGPGAVLSAGGVPAIEETRSYITKITSLAGAFADTTGGGLPTGSFAARFIAAAQQQTGAPYVWGGGSPTGPTTGLAGGSTVGFDCSGLVLYAAYQASGGQLKLPHFADSQTRAGTPVPLSQLRPGDVISFTAPGQSVAHHIGIYVGNDSLLNAPRTGKPVQISPLSSWRGEQWRAVRYG